MSGKTTSKYIGVHLSEGVKPMGTVNTRPNAGIGYVVLHPELDRDSYLKRCIRLNTVNIITENGEYIVDCIVPKGLIYKLNFPLTLNERGSAILWLNLPIKNKAIVVNTYNKRDEKNESADINKEILGAITGDASAQIIFDKFEGLIDVIVSGKGASSSQINFKALNEFEEAIVDFYIQGDFKIYAEDEIVLRSGTTLNLIIEDEAQNKRATIKYDLGEGLKISDEFKNEFVMHKDGITLNTINKIVAKSNNSQNEEPAMLGDSTVELLKSVFKSFDKCIRLITTAPDVSGYVMNPNSVNDILRELLRLNKTISNIDELKSKTNFLS